MPARLPLASRPSVPSSWATVCLVIWPTSSPVATPASTVATTSAQEIVDLAIKQVSPNVVVSVPSARTPWVRPSRTSASASKTPQLQSPPSVIRTTPSNRRTHSSADHEPSGDPGFGPRQQRTHRGAHAFSANPGGKRVLHAAAHWAAAFLVLGDLAEA